MSESIVMTRSGQRHAVEHAYSTGRSRTACGRVVWGQVFPRDFSEFADYPVTCTVCIRTEARRTWTTS